MLGSYSRSRLLASDGNGWVRNLQSTLWQVLQANNRTSVMGVVNKCTISTFGHSSDAMSKMDKPGCFLRTGSRMLYRYDKFERLGTYVFLNH